MKLETKRDLDQYDPTRVSVLILFLFTFTKLAREKPENLNFIKDFRIFLGE